MPGWACRGLLSGLWSASWDRGPADDQGAAFTPELSSTLVEGAPEDVLATHFWLLGVCAAGTLRVPGNGIGEAPQQKTKTFS